MNNQFDNAYLNQHTDNVIKRGYEIYDEWINKKLDSRKIVASAVNAVNHFKKRKNTVAFIDALAYLFALDTRIKDKYNNIVRCLFSYFSWRRETRALGSLKNTLNIPLGDTDIRNAIAVVIERLAEKLENGWDEEGDDDIDGGKRNGKAAEEATTEEKEMEETAEEKLEAKELDDKEEKETDAEEKEESPIEEGTQEDVMEETAEEIKTDEPQQMEDEIKPTDEKEELIQKNEENLKEENNLSDNESELSIDKKEEAKTYNDAVDSPPLYEEATVSERSDEKTSFIDEMIIDNMVKGDKSIIGYQRIDEAERLKEAYRPQDTVASKNEETQSTEKNDYLYDKTLANDKGNIQQSNNNEVKQETPKVELEQPTAPIQNNDIVPSNEQEFRPIGEMLQSNNVDAGFDNDIANALNETMSLESKLAYIQMKADVFREQISISNKELGIDENIGVFKLRESEQVNQPTVTQNVK